jgi:hypothetical protein
MIEATSRTPQEEVRAALEAEMAARHTLEGELRQAMEDGWRSLTQSAKEGRMRASVALEDWPHRNALIGAYTMKAIMEKHGIVEVSLELQQLVQQCFDSVVDSNAFVPALALDRTIDFPMVLLANRAKR